LLKSPGRVLDAALTSSCLKQVADEIFPRGASFSDMIGVIEMPQNQ